ncbi:YggS family pyridoxal phosphate-dependent enzyme [Kordiimonas marina]|uniref:YggS family pyridoxal phosphate-dependent enzyme n=1 Tax=Kordiimonas marina TaxID=2872312 RepID=UPI001FF66B58|nr:YggS family pyridoxal phosphate-dependent enzyme [Kordiimonas marina]MCJ9429833.1 YggS family pyridoxal phosphate-dependent enzyme [Kordiimonas marina]
MQGDIAANIAHIQDEVAKMCAHADVPLNEPRLIAVSKVQPKERVVAALEAGQRVFGENRVQEAEERWGELKPLYPGVELHLIGGLQTNKAAKAVELFDCIQSVDRPKLARALAAEMDKQDRHLPIYLQVNTGREEQKGGCLVEDLPALLETCKELGLKVVGLMCIPPVGDDPSLHFALLRKLGRQYGLERLSMGMSGDYALAASMGATDIRVGTGIFGERDYG